MEEFYDSAFENLQKGKECNRTDPIPHANYVYDRLCFILVPLRGKIKNKILVAFRGRFKKIRRAPLSLLYGSPPWGVKALTHYDSYDNTASCIHYQEHVL